MDVGARIKALREEKGWTVNKLAYISGVSQSYLRDLELSNKQPTVEYLGYICDGLGISLSAFFQETPEGKWDSVLRKLSLEQQELLFSFLNSL